MIDFNITDFGCREIYNTVTVNYDPTLFIGSIGVLIILLVIIVFFDIELKKRWIKNEIPKV